VKITRRNILDKCTCHGDNISERTETDNACRRFQIEFLLSSRDDEKTFRSPSHVYDT